MLLKIITRIVYMESILALDPHFIAW